MDLWANLCPEWLISFCMGQVVLGRPYPLCWIALHCMPRMPLKRRSPSWAGCHWLWHRVQALQSVCINTLACSSFSFDESGSEEYFHHWFWAGDENVSHRRFGRVCTSTLAACSSFSFVLLVSRVRHWKKLVTQSPHDRLFEHRTATIFHPFGQLYSCWTS